MFHSSHSTGCAEICPQVWFRVSLSPTAILDIPILAAAPIPRMLLHAPSWPAGPTEGTCLEGRWQLSPGTWAGCAEQHIQQKGEKKDLKYFLSLAFEKYWLFQCSSVPLVAYSTAQSSSPLWCFAHSIINCTKEKKNSSSLWKPWKNELEMRTEAASWFLQQQILLH